MQNKRVFNELLWGASLSVTDRCQKHLHVPCRKHHLLSLLQVNTTQTYVLFISILCSFVPNMRIPGHYSLILLFFF